MIVEKGYFHFAEKYWGGGEEGQGPPGSPCTDGLVMTLSYPLRYAKRLVT